MTSWPRASELGKVVVRCQDAELRVRDMLFLKNLFAALILGVAGTLLISHAGRGRSTHHD